MGTIITFNGDSLHTYIEQDVAPHAQQFLPSKKKKKTKSKFAPIYFSSSLKIFGLWQHDITHYHVTKNSTKKIHSIFKYI